MSVIYTVKELTAKVKQSLEGQYPFVWVKGEVSNVSRPSSGHVYFSLKDNDALLHCVWFKNFQKQEENFDPLTGEVFEDGPRPSLAQKLTNGQQILCAGHISVYAPRGSYQLVVALMQEGGLGALHAAFEATKEKLRAQGYFSPERKRALPYNPQKIAVVTAPTGAAIYDFLRIAEQGGTGSAVRVYPVLVQGQDAAPSIVKAIQSIEREAWADVIVLIRGGGSLEDLWAFNEEMVAHAVFTSSIPVLAGIGHEVDVSIADMTADVRAATPTHAAQILWPAREELMQRVDSFEITLKESFERILRQHTQKLHMQQQALQWLSPMRHWQRQHEKLAHCEQVLGTSFKGYVEKYQILLETLCERLQSLGLQNVRVKEGQMAPFAQNLFMGMRHYLQEQEHKLEQWHTRLMACDPKMPLQRGYVLMENEQGQVLASVQQVQKGEQVRMHMADGIVAANVSHIQAHKNT